MTAVRISLVLLAFLPFAWYAGRDAIFHFRGRQVSLPEHMLHLVIGLGIFVVLVQALLGSLLLLLHQLHRPSTQGRCHIGRAGF